MLVFKKTFHKCMLSMRPYHVTLKKILLSTAQKSPVIFKEISIIPKIMP